MGPILISNENKGLWNSTQLFEEAKDCYISITLATGYRYMDAAIIDFILPIIVHQFHRELISLVSPNLILVGKEVMQITTGYLITVKTGILKEQCSIQLWHTTMPCINIVAFNNAMYINKE